MICGIWAEMVSNNEIYLQAACFSRQTACIYLQNYSVNGTAERHSGDQLFKHGSIYSTETVLGSLISEI